MLTTHGSAGAMSGVDESTSNSGPASDTRATATPGSGSAVLARILTVEWLGQTVASLCWIGSMFTYGISSSGDWLQLFAASAWLVANVASVSTKSG